MSHHDEQTSAPPRMAYDPQWPEGWTEEQKQSWRATAAKIEAQKTAAAVPASDIQNRRYGAAINDLNDQRVALRNYLHSKMGAEDWHAVADAAMDLREIDAKLSVLRG